MKELIIVLLYSVTVPSFQVLIFSNAEATLQKYSY